MKLIVFLSIILFNIPSICFSQKKYPTNYFRNPLSIPIKIAGTFGELRSNHFHSGMDIKTREKQGLKIYAPADGYVSRIKISQWGYGKALYIKHPNGYTTVFAHLSKYNDSIQAYVKKIQYKKELYEVGNIYPKPGLFPVKKGQIIAYSGNTGGSTGPHLHYEIRNTKTQQIINPMSFGLVASDVRAPVFKKLSMYNLDENSKNYNKPKRKLIPIDKIKNNTYQAGRIFANGTVGFGVQVFDRLSGTPNKNGIYSLEMKVNGSRVCFYSFETFSFNENKYINLLIDYPYYINHKIRIQKTYREKANKLSIYKDVVNQAKLVVKNGQTYRIEIIARDFKGNASTLNATVVGVKKSVNRVLKQADTTAYKVQKDKFAKFQSKNVTVAFAKNTFYRDCYLDFKVSKGIAHIHNPTVALDRKFTLTFDISKYSPEQKKQLYIAQANNPKYPKYQRSVKKENKIYTTTKTLGNYTLRRDTLKPTINLINFEDGKWISKIKTLKVRIKDADSGIKSYRATIDKQWVLMEYEHKNHTLSYDFGDKKLVGSKHFFNLVVSDNVGNIRTVSVVFYRKK